jgi:hypothetical protein
MHDDYLPAGNTASRYAPLRRCGAAGSAALLLAMLAACPGSASSSTAAAPPAAATPRGAAARPSTDAAVAAVALPIPVESAPADFRSALDAIFASLSLRSWNDWQILVDNAERKERLDWLAKDFGTRVFRLADRVDEAHLHAQTSAGPLHVGFLVARFPKCKQLTDAYSAVVKTGRSNFALPILTIFRSKARGHSLLFLFSETTQQPQVSRLLERYDSLLGAEIHCSDGK